MKVLKRSVGSMPRDIEKDIEIHAGTGEMEINVVNVAEWKTECKSYFNRYYKTSSIIMVPSDGDTIMNTVSSVCSDREGRGFVLKDYDIVTHFDFLGYDKVALRKNLGVAPTSKSVSYIAYLEQKNGAYM